MCNTSICSTAPPRARQRRAAARTSLSAGPLSVSFVAATRCTTLKAQSGARQHAGGQKGATCCLPLLLALHPGPAGRGEPEFARPRRMRLAASSSAVQCRRSCCRPAGGGYHRRRQGRHHAGRPPAAGGLERDIRQQAPRREQVPEACAGAAAGPGRTRRLGRRCRGGGKHRWAGLRAAAQCSPLPAASPCIPHTPFPPAVLLTMPGSALGTDAAAAAFARSLGPAVAGKVVIDATNPLNDELTELCWARGRSSAEVLQQELPGGRGRRAKGAALGPWPRAARARSRRLAPPALQRAPSSRPLTAVSTGEHPPTPDCWPCCLQLQAHPPAPRSHT